MGKVMLGVLVSFIAIFLGWQHYQTMQERNLCEESREARRLRCQEVRTISEGGLWGEEGTCLCTPRRTNVEVMFNAELNHGSSAPTLSNFLDNR